MNINFSESLNTSFSSNVGSYLKPYDIYKVTLEKIEKTELKGTKDPTAVYSVVSLEFKGEAGSFNENIFIPSAEEDFVRNESQNHKILPSRFDKFQYTLMQIVEAINPKGADKIRENASKIKTIDAFIEMIIKALANTKTKEVYLKLVGRNSGGRTFACLPNSCLIGNEGKPIPLNFINEDPTKLFFSSYETQQMEAYKKATPTPMSSVDTKKEDSDELDLSDIDFN